ncbi:hypothetical protein [Bradyrhizobium diazoefficiens]
MEQDFGRYLLSVEERDIDLLLMEEFHISPDFVAWFARQVGLEGARFAGAWHSVTDAGDGETDLLLRVVAETRKIAILIENKVAAPEQDRQDERYHIRSARSRDAGLFDAYTTCICAPSAYLAGLRRDTLFEHRVSYEVIRDWYTQFQDARSLWRQRIMSEAIDQSRRGYVMVVNATKSTFHRDYWQYLQRKHPRLLMRQPKEKGSKSDWIILKTFDMPKGVSIDHKIDQSCVDLTFHRTRLDDLLSVRRDWPNDILPLQRGGSTVLRKLVPKLDMERSLLDQTEFLERTLSVAYELSGYCRLMQRG